MRRRQIRIAASGQRHDPAISERHARFAAACAVNEMLLGKPVWEVGYLKPY